MRGKKIERRECGRGGETGGQGIRGNFTLYHKNERFSIFLISVNNSTNTLQGKELINANIYRYSERAKTADKLMKFLHDNNNANADNDDSGKLHAESSLRNMKSTYWTKGGREGCGWVDYESLPLKHLFPPNCLYYRQTFKWATRALVGAGVVCLTEVGCACAWARGHNDNYRNRGWRRAVTKELYRVSSRIW